MGRLIVRSGPALFLLFIEGALSVKLLSLPGTTIVFGRPPAASEALARAVVPA